MAAQRCFRDPRSNSISELRAGIKGINGIRNCEPNEGDYLLQIDGVFSLSSIQMRSGSESPRATLLDYDRIKNGGQATVEEHLCRSAEKHVTQLSYRMAW